ncbi:glycosyltransferase [Endozoicomonas sp. SM1973]|uniref:Glycosyltransferase n=1 Tax=Spartinivicinus marinus TaxID=2994442 RepID=A0A853HZI4_9GAMM|nr:glycosyltransferase [Spartinivicinus marinus]MCX4026110.1 glycosyltransferase [Spartinivicinus marinus]NYZ66593.1 glycosyltransferase [Spartinivicinus marinus]
MNQPHVLQLCHGYEPPFLDVARQYAGLFADTPYKVTTVYLTGEFSDQVANESSSDEVFFLENTSRDVRGLKRKQIKQLQRICEQRQFSFAIAHRFKPLYICSHIPDLFTVGVHHAFGDYQRKTRRWFVNRRQQRLALLGVSNAVRDDIRHCLPHWSSDRIQTLYNRVDYEQLKANLVEREAARKYLGLTQNQYVFANVGRLHPDKDQTTLLKAFALIAGQLPNAVLAILGQGRLESELKQLAQSLGIAKQVLFLGMVPEAAQYYKAFDSFVLTSDHEPFGMVLLEAMAAGLPVIATDCGGGKEVVEGCGQLFPLGDAQQLASHMTQIYGLSSQDKTALADKMDAKVTQNFSYSVVKDHFWQLPFIKPYAMKMGVA